MKLEIRPLRSDEPLVTCNVEYCAEDGTYLLNVEILESIRHVYCTRHLREYIMDFMEQLV